MTDPPLKIPKFVRGREPAFRVPANFYDSASFSAPAFRETVFGTIGRRFDSATDNAPLDMYDTTIMLKPQEKWRPGMTYEKLIQEMDAKLQFPGLSNTWTMPVENRLDMELTGIRTPLGMKMQSPTLDGIQQVGAQIQQLLSNLPKVRSVFAGRVSQGFT